MLSVLVREYGITWLACRILYSAKLFLLRLIPCSEIIFEHSVKVQRTDIFSFDVKEIASLLAELPEDDKTALIEVADKAVNGVLKAFSSKYHNYGLPINWQYSPLTGKECSKTGKWYRIPDFDKERGDIKIIWEASRLTHFLYFARAYLLTKDKKYYDAFSSQLENWLAENKYSFGANYKCGQECTLRMLNSLVAYNVFRICGCISDKDTADIMQLVRESYRKVLSNFFYAHRCIKNNHTFSEICGLIVGAWCCRDKHGLQKAYGMLDEEIAAQFYKDGGYKQFSFNYQRFTFQIIECVLKLSEKTGFSISQSSKETIKKSVLLLYNCQDQSGKLPNYGSNDGALVFPVTACDYTDFRPVLNTLYAQLSGKRLYEDGVYDEELLWFAEQGLTRESLTRVDAEYNDSGFYVMRHGSNSFLMICLQDFKTRPSHMDQLHIDLWHDGINIFCDSGTYSYASDTGRKLSMTAAHNTVMIDDLEQMDKHGAFLVYNWTIREESTESSGCFEGMLSSRNGYKHKRVIERTSDGYKLNDTVYADGDICRILFHTPCSVKLSANGFILSMEGRDVCSVESSGTVSVSDAEASWYYLSKEHINCVSVVSKIVDGVCTNEFIIKLL